MIQRYYIFGLLDEKGEEKGRGKRRKTLCKENIWKANEMRNGEKKRKYLEKEDILFAEEKKNGKGK